MKEEQISSPTPESIEKKRALEFLALSPTEKYETRMRLKKIGDVINNAGKGKITPAKEITSDLDFINMWEGLYNNNVRYLTIGEFAVCFYGYTRLTGILEILIEDNNKNRKNLRKALKDIGIGDFEQIETTQLIPGWTDFTLG